MGEALINHLGKGRYRAFSAGSRPAGFVHQKAIDTLRKHGIEPGTPRSKSWDEFADTEVDLVITVCDQAASESCPLFPGPAQKKHWSIPDPAAVQPGHSEDAVCQAFEKAFTMLKQHIEKEL